MEYINLLVAVIVQGVAAFIWYKIGYARREYLFQNNPITFAKGVENALQVDGSGSKVKVTIYNKKLVEFVD